MYYRQLGTSGLQVSALTLGTMGFGGVGWAAMVGSVGIDGVRRQVEIALDAGVNLIDTADVYSEGLSEQLVGEALAPVRDRVLIATKVRMPMGDGPNDAGLSRHHILRAAEASLRRLRVDHIDLYQVHAWDGQTPLEETLSALDSLVRSGKVRYLGSSNYSAWHMMKALGVSASTGTTPFVAQQIHYSLQAREAENELIPLAVDQGVGVLVWSPLAGGLLSGKYLRDAPPAEGRQLGDWGEPPVSDEARLYDIVDELVVIAAEREVPVAHVALAWTLGRPAVTSTVVGARTEEQLVENLAAADLTLSPAENARLDQVSRTPLLYPYWHQAATSGDRLSAADLTLLAPHVPDEH